MANNSAATVDSTERETLAQECIDLLVQHGYHRASVIEIPIFERVVGGLVFCLQSEALTSVDCDILFRPVATVKERVRVAEAICHSFNTALMSFATATPSTPSMKALTLSVHELQGANYAKLKLVVAWLVQHTQVKLNTRIQQAILTHYTTTMRSMLECTSGAAVGNSGGDVTTDDFDRLYKTAEQEASAAEQRALQEQQRLQDELLQHAATTHGDQWSHAGTLQAASLVYGTTSEAIREHLRQQAQGNPGSTAEAFGWLATQRKLSRDREQLIQKARAQSLIALHTNLKLQESQFKAACAEQLAELQRNELKRAVAKESQAVVAVMRKIDDIPSRSELIQYEKRFAELYDEVALIDSINENFEVALASPDTTDLFFGQMHTIIANVQENVKKQEANVAARQVTVDTLDSKYQLQAYLAAIREFQKECETNAKLTNHIDTLRMTAPAM
ncbi:hypothetical protein DYB32_008862 [Aphanomyces invadans]|uniref:Uncharacterized protein n=1 Tax=Aphanomyces invadans TaxID=157072 RepID=A0A3R6YUM8_9STRA|nr:hypothetical protein DYB32_008862 [Aphanomyces invadans]